MSDRVSGMCTGATRMLRGALRVGTGGPSLKHGEPNVVHDGRSFCIDTAQQDVPMCDSATCIWQHMR